MSTRFLGLFGLVMVGAGLSSLLHLRGLGPTPTLAVPAGAPPNAPAAGPASGVALPSGFVANEGQWNTPARFVLRRGGSLVEVLPDGLRCRSARTRAGQPLQLTFEGSNAAAVEGREALPGVRHYFLGNDPSRWRTHVKTYDEVLWKHLYPGVDVRLVTTADDLRYDLLLAPDADLGRVRVRCDGHSGLELEADGALRLHTVQGTVRQSPPVAWHETPGGQRLEAQCRFVCLDDDRFGFVLDGPRLDLPLVVDPGLDFYVFLGGASLELVNAVAEAHDGSLFVVGRTQSADFPVTPGAAQTTTDASEDGYVAHIDARARTLIYATYLGGHALDDVKAVVVNSAGEAFVTGETLSTNFPVTPNAFQTQLLAWSAAFITRLRSDGSRFMYSTYLGGSSINNAGYAIDLVADDEAIVAGRTYSPDFPLTPGAFRTRYGGGSEAFVTHLNATGSGLVASTFFGGDSSAEEARYVRVHSSGYVTIAGRTLSSDMPVTANAFQPTLGGSLDAFLAILSPDLRSLTYGTYYGGSAVEEAYFSQNAAGQVVIVGRTGSPNLPAARGSLQGTNDFYAAVFDPVHLVAARYINTPDNSSAPWATNIDPSGVVTFSASMAAGFPTTPGAWQLVPRVLPGGGFVARLGPDLDIWYASYFGGSVGDGPDTLARTLDGWTLLAGRGASPDMPTAGVFNTSLHGMNDGFVARMDLLPAGVERYGSSSAACAGPIVMDVTRMPAAGTRDFTLVSSAAPPSASGWLLLGSAPDVPGTPLLGATLHVGSSAPLVAVPVTSTPTGLAAVRLPLLAIPRGAQTYAQFVFVNSATCRGSGPLSSSFALHLTVQ